MIIKNSRFAHGDRRQPDIVVTVTAAGPAAGGRGDPYGISARARSSMPSKLRKRSKKAGLLTRDPENEGAQEVRPEKARALPSSSASFPMFPLSQS
jgi:ribosomal protein S9